MKKKLKIKRLKKEVKQLKRALKAKEARMRSAMGALALVIDPLNMVIKDLYQPWPGHRTESRATSPSSQKEESQSPQLEIVSARKTRR